MKGKYKGRAKTWGLGETSKGDPQVAVEFTIPVEGGDPALRTWYGYFTDKTADRTIESLRTCGWKGDDLSDLTGLDANEVELVIDEEEYPVGSGKMRDKVEWINKLSSGAILKTPMSEDKAKSFAAQMKARIRAFDAAGGKKTTAQKSNGSAAPASPEPPPISDADLPF